MNARHGTNPSGEMADYDLMILFHPETFGFRGWHVGGVPLGPSQARQPPGSTSMRVAETTMSLCRKARLPSERALYRSRATVCACLWSITFAVNRTVTLNTLNYSSKIAATSFNAQRNHLNFVFELYFPDTYIKRET